MSGFILKNSIYLQKKKMKRNETKQNKNVILCNNNPRWEQKCIKLSQLYKNFVFQRQPNNNDNNRKQVRNMQSALPFSIQQSNTFSNPLLFI